MPFTPYHVGPALLVALLLYPLLDIPSFIVASLIIDFEPFLALFNLLPWSPHGVFHSFTMGIPVGLLVAGGFYLLRKYSKPIPLPKAFQQEPSIRNTVISSVTGVCVHVVLDAFVHSDLNLFYPMNWSPLLHLVPRSTVCLLYTSPSPRDRS